MNAVERLADALKVSGKIRGHKVPIYRADKSLDHYARQMTEVMAGDIMEAVSEADLADEIVAALQQGSRGFTPEQKVVVLADDVFHLIDKAGPGKTAARKAQEAGP